MEGRESKHWSITIILKIKRQLDKCSGELILYFKDLKVREDLRFVCKFCAKHATLNLV